MLISTDELSDFSGKYPENDDKQKNYIAAATEIIGAYLGYDPLTYEGWRKEHEKTITVYSTDGTTFYINDAYGVVADIPDGVTPEPTLFENQYQYTVVVSEIIYPDSVKLVCKEISTLMQEEENQNIGINSKSFGESGTRSFLNVVSYDKYLARISRFRDEDALVL